MRISDWSSDVCSSDLRDADDLGRVDDTGLDEVFIDVGRGVEAEARVLLVEQLARDDTAVEARVFGDLADRSLQRTTDDVDAARSEEHTSELQSLMRISYAVFCLKKTKKNKIHTKNQCR